MPCTAIGLVLDINNQHEVRAPASHEAGRLARAFDSSLYAGDLSGFASRQDIGSPRKLSQQQHHTSCGRRAQLQGVSWNARTDHIGAFSFMASHSSTCMLFAQDRCVQSLEREIP